MKAAAATDDTLLRQSYLDLAVSYDKLADTMERQSADAEIMSR